MFWFVELWKVTVRHFWCTPGGLRERLPRYSQNILPILSIELLNMIDPTKYFQWWPGFITLCFETFHGLKPWLWRVVSSAFVLSSSSYENSDIQYSQLSRNVFTLLMFWAHSNKHLVQLVLQKWYGCFSWVENQTLWKSSHWNSGCWIRYSTD